MNPEIKILEKMRADMDARIIDAKMHQAVIEKPSRAIAVAITKLEEAKMWMGKRFEEIEEEKA